MNELIENEVVETRYSKESNGIENNLKNGGLGYSKCINNFNEPVTADECDFTAVQKLLNENRPKEIHPYVYHLRKIDWFIFGTLTWKKLLRRRDNASAQWKRERDFKDLIRVFCGRVKIREKNLAFYRATEFGESDEAHFHFLIAKVGLKNSDARFCADTLQNLWKYKLRPFDGKRYGIGEQIDIRPFEEAKKLSGVEYCLKREFNSAGIERERDDYLSPALVKLIARTDSLRR